MSDNSSFLKLLGFEGGAEAKDTALPEEVVTDESGSNSVSETDWDLGAEGPVFPSENTMANEVATEFTTAHAEWAEAVLQETNNEEIIQDEPTSEISESPVEDVLADEPTAFSHDEFNDSTEEVVRADEIKREQTFVTEKTPMQLKPEHEVVDEAVDSNESTATYDRTDSNILEHEDSETQVELAEASAIKTKSLRADKEATQGTVPFEYAEGSENKTAHFSYDNESAGSRLVLLEGQANTRAVHLHQLPVRMGRDPKNEFILDDLNASRFHAEIQNRDGKIIVLDLGSTNGIKVNGQLVPEAELNAHDVIQVGDCLLEYLPGGILSKGAPKTNALQDTASGADPHMRRRFAFIGGVVALIAVVFILFGRKNSIEDTARDIAKSAGSKMVVSEIENIRTSIENQAQRKAGDLSANELKKNFIDRLETSKLGGLIPKAVRENIQQVPASVFKYFIENPSIIAGIIQKGADAQAVDGALRDVLNTLITKKEFTPDTLALAEFLEKSSPQDESLKTAITQLRELVKTGGVAGNKEGGARAFADLTDEEKKFYEYMDNYEAMFNESVAQNRFTKALSFSKEIRQRLTQLLKLSAAFERVAKPEMEKWDLRIAQMERSVLGEQKQKDAEVALQQKVAQEIKDIRMHLELGEAGEVRKRIEGFLKKYPQSARLPEVAGLRRELEASLAQSFSSTRTSVERFVKTESYENAWKELYKFLDVMPTHSQALEMRASMDKSTRPKAVQFYNQARVYEFEADDLVAAEQYYKRAMEVADPRSEISKKAERRYAEVKRKTIH